MNKPPVKGTSMAAQNPDGPADQLFAPSAARNLPAVLDFMRPYAPNTGKALEIASGTGQHIAAFAQAFPNIQWLPTDIADDRLASINSYAKTPNQLPAKHLSATTPDWSDTSDTYDLVYLANLLHLISTPDTKTVITECARALNVGGAFLIYGPFMRAGQLTSEGDERFHASIISQNPDLGYKNDADILKWASNTGLTLTKTHDLPANNLGFVFHKS